MPDPVFEAYRDFFAAHALAGVLGKNPAMNHPSCYENFARSCYRMADAMLAVRKETPAAAQAPDAEVVYLARVFSAKLRRLVGDDKVARINERNAAEPDPNVCHSHDVCDANMVMLDALLDLGHPEPDPGDEKAVAFMDRAWAVARRSGFDASPGEQKEATA